MLIKVKNIKCETEIGVYDSEKGKKQPVLVNLRIDYDEGISPKTDKVEDTINYHTIVDEIRNHINNNKFGLVERVLEDLGKIVLAHKKVKSARIEVSKPKGPLNYIDDFSVTKTFYNKN